MRSPEVVEVPFITRAHDGRPIPVSDLITTLIGFATQDIDAFAPILADHLRRFQPRDLVERVLVQSIARAAFQQHQAGMIQTRIAALAAEPDVLTPAGRELLAVIESAGIASVINGLDHRRRSHARQAKSAMYALKRIRRSFPLPVERNEPNPVERNEANPVGQTRGQSRRTKRTH